MKAWHENLVRRTAAPIIEEVAHKHYVPVEVLSDKTRVCHAVLARWEAMFRLYQSGLSTTEIGVVLNRNNRTVGRGIMQFIKRSDS